MIKEKEHEGVKTPSTRKMIRCPRKTGINMNMREGRGDKVKTVAIGGAVIALLCVIVAKVGVIDLYGRLSKAEGEYQTAHRQNTELEARLSDYDRVLLEYRTYSMDWMTGSTEVDGENGADQRQDRLVKVQRRAVLDLIETVMMPRGSVDAVDIKDDTAEVYMSGMSLSEISDMFSVIEKQPIVSRVELNLAETEKDRPASVLSFSLTITLQQEDDAQ